VILAASFLKGSTVWGFMMLSAFALGFGIPLALMIVGVSLGLGKISKTLSLIVTIVKYIGGIILVALGFYLLISV
jgi:cytochrome c biogenesis protein CcdA